MAFCGTQDKCKACDKTVHFIDLLTADGIPYHKTCFKCSHCRGLLSDPDILPKLRHYLHPAAPGYSHLKNLQVSSYSSMDSVLYCKPHFEQLFKETGNFTKNFQTSYKTSDQLSRTPSRVSSMFSGTQDKCATCKKTVYPLEKITLEGEQYHKTCFKCYHGGCTLTPSSYAALDGVLYCTHHFSQLFKEKGNYNNLLKHAKRNPEMPAELENPEPSAEA